MLAFRAWFCRTCVCAVAIFVLAAPPSVIRADTQDVDLLLVLAADVSRSIDDTKFKLQREGYAAAITDPVIVKAMQSAGPKRRIGLMFIEWAGAGETKIIVDWASIGSPEEAKTFADVVLASPRPFYGRTSIAGTERMKAGLPTWKSMATVK